MSTVIPSTKSIVKQLLTLASDPENQVYIAEEAGAARARAAIHARRPRITRAHPAPLLPPRLHERPRHVSVACGR